MVDTVSTKGSILKTQQYMFRGLTLIVDEMLESSSTSTSTKT